MPPSSTYTPVKLLNLTRAGLEPAMYSSRRTHMDTVKVLPMAESSRELSSTEPVPVSLADCSM